MRLGRALAFVGAFVFCRTSFGLGLLRCDVHSTSLVPAISRRVCAPLRSTGSTIRRPFFVHGMAPASLFFSAPCPTPSSFLLSDIRGNFRSQSAFALLQFPADRFPKFSPFFSFPEQRRGCLFAEVLEPAPSGPFLFGMAAPRPDVWPLPFGAHLSHALNGLDPCIFAAGMLSKFIRLRFHFPFFSKRPRSTLFIMQGFFFDFGHLESVFSPSEDTLHVRQRGLFICRRLFLSFYLAGSCPPFVLVARLAFSL